MTLPWECDEVLKADLPVEPVVVERLWDRLSQMIAEPNEFNDGGGILALKDAVCGAAATLLCLAPDWLASRPEAATQCQQIILQASANPVEQRIDPQYQFTATWDSFCARALPALWAAEPYNPELLRRVGLLALSPHPRTVSSLLVAAFGEREALGEHFGRLRHLVLLSSRAYHLAGEAAWWEHVWRNQWRRPGLIPRLRRGIQRVRQFRIEPWMRRNLREFVGQRISPECPPLEEFAVWSHPRTTKHGMQRRGDGGLDPYWVWAAYEWLPVDFESAVEPKTFERACDRRAGDDLVSVAQRPGEGSAEIIGFFFERR